MWIDQLRDWLAFGVLKRQSRTKEEIAAWRDRHYITRFIYFLVCLVALPHLQSVVVDVLWVISGLFLFDMLGALAGAAFVWHKVSISSERLLITSLINYVQLIIAFAGFYRICGCFCQDHVEHALQAVYFSTAIATTVGLGVPNPAYPWGMLLVMIQLSFTVFLVLVVISIFLSRLNS
jgi:hypothetical protein